MLAKIEKRLSKRDENKLLMKAEQKRLIVDICYVNFSLVTCYKNEVQWVTLF